MELDYWEGWFRFRGPKEASELVRNAGFFLDDNGYWLTQDIYAALRLSHYAKSECKTRLEEAREDAERNIHNSHAISANGFDPPVPDGLRLLDYQKAGIAYLSEHKRGLLADEMGLGKTIQAIGFINLLAVESVLIVCPASLKLNWRDELRKWLTLKLTYEVATANFWPLSDIVIINYELLKKCRKAIHKRKWDILIGDEIHYVKNKNAVRSKEFVSIPHTYGLGLTGTPIPNRPVEIFNILAWLQARAFPSYRAFKQRYEGGSNLQELHNRLRSGVMVRRLKKEVLKELPAKIRQIIEIPSDGVEETIRYEIGEWEAKQKRIQELKRAVELAKETNSQEEYKQAVKELREQVVVVFSEMSKVRLETALAKIPYAIDHLEDCIESEGKVVCFAYHKEVMDKIEEHFGERSVKIHGDTKEHDRHEAINRFQRNRNVQLFIGSFLAAGTGITLTASSHVVFVELDWRPYVITQAEDRCHRIGQKDSVLCQHILFEKSLDAKIAKRIVEKQTVIDKTLDNVETNS